MALPVPGRDARGLLNFRLLGFPVSIHASFLLVVGLFHFSISRDLRDTAIWVAVVTVSVIAHELGHALLAAPCGGQPRIDLYGMAGLTTWQPGRASRGRRVAVSVAGPAAGVAFGLAALAAGAALRPEPGSAADAVVAYAAFANLLWGLLNLLPILPLDGGQVVHALMPGRDPATRLRRTAYLSIGVAAVVAVAAFAVGEHYGAAFIVYFAFGNVQTVRALSQAQTGTPFAQRLNAAEEAIANARPEEALSTLPEPDQAPAEWRAGVALLRSMALLRLDRAADAQRTLVDGLPDGMRLDPAYEGAVLLANGQDRLARERLASMRHPAPWAVRELTALLLRRGEDPDPVLGDLAPEAAAGAHQACLAAGDWGRAGRWGEVALRAADASPFVAYTTACAWSRAEDAPRALRALDVAVDLGFRDLATAESDPDLALARGARGWDEVAERLRGLGAPPQRG
ncbi:MAG TPA: site-2 protease family protein [Mycobacteriales bacterium]|nr:site-2 protease family protein [Mycobacteriales bacterium]